MGAKMIRCSATTTISVNLKMSVMKFKPFDFNKLPNMAFVFGMTESCLCEFFIIKLPRQNSREDGSLDVACAECGAHPEKPQSLRNELNALALFLLPVGADGVKAIVQQVGEKKTDSYRDSLISVHFHFIYIVAQQCVTCH